MYSKNTARVLTAAGVTGFICGEQRDGTIILTWQSGQPQSTDEQITAWAANAAPLPNGQLFSEWQAENGGDEKKTRKKAIRQAFQDAVNDNDVASVGLRALIDVVADRLGAPRKDIRQDTLNRMFKIIDKDD